jgi:hypothetical protein
MKKQLKELEIKDAIYCKDYVRYPTSGAKYRHYKGGLYKVIGITKQHDDETILLVIYKSLTFGTLHNRPLAEFFEEIIVEEKFSSNGNMVKVYRFSFVK